MVAVSANGQWHEPRGHGHEWNQRSPLRFCWCVRVGEEYALRGSLLPPPTILVSIWCDSRPRSIPTSRSLSRFTDPVRRNLRSRFPYFLYIFFLFSDHSLLGWFLFLVLDLWTNDSALTEMHAPFIFFRVLQMRVSALCNTQRFESMSLFLVRCKLFVS